jgi:hypothetical protein
LTSVEARLDAEDEGEVLNIVLEVGEQESPLAPFLQVEQVPALEVAGQNVSWPLRLREPVVVIKGLVARLAKIETGGLLLDDERARPEQVDEALLVARQVLDPLLIGGDLAAADAEAIEEVVVEGLGLALLVVG